MKFGDPDNLFNTDFEDDNINFVIAAVINDYIGKNIASKPCRTSALIGHNYIIELINGHEDRCYDQFRIRPHVFISFCEAIRTHGLLDHSRYLLLQEQVGIFLLIVSHNERFRVVAERFQHSVQIIYLYFHKVLKAVCRLDVVIIVPPNMNEVPPEILHNPTFYPFFKDCIGAIDRTHVFAHVPARKQIAYHGKQTIPSQNVMVACSLRFTYVFTGWKGTVNDSRVLNDCLSNPANLFPAPPEGKYYVVDFAYQNVPGFWHHIVGNCIIYKITVGAHDDLCILKSGSITGIHSWVM